MIISYQNCLKLKCWLAVVLRWGYFIQKRWVWGRIHSKVCECSTKLHSIVRYKLPLLRKSCIWHYRTGFQKNAQKVFHEFYIFWIQLKTGVFWVQRDWKHLGSSAYPLYTRYEDTFCQEYREDRWKLNWLKPKGIHGFPIYYGPNRLLWEIPGIGSLWPHKNWWHLSPRQNSVARAVLPSSIPFWGSYQKEAVIKRWGRRQLEEWFLAFEGQIQHWDLWETLGVSWGDAW